MNSKLKSPNQPKKEESETIYLMNPTSEEFTTTYFNDKNETVSVTIEPLKSKEFPTNIGKTVLNHLIDFVINQGGFAYKTDINLEKARIRKECVLYE